MLNLDFGSAAERCLTTSLIFRSVRPARLAWSWEVLPNSASCCSKRSVIASNADFCTSCGASTCFRAWLPSKKQITIFVVVSSLVCRSWSSTEPGRQHSLHGFTSHAGTQADMKTNGAHIVKCATCQEPYCLTDSQSQNVDFNNMSR